MMSPWSIPAVPRVSPGASSYIVELLTKWSIDLYAASLEVKPSPTSIHYAHLTWEPMDSVGWKCRPWQNESNQTIVYGASGISFKVFLQMRNYQPACSGNSFVCAWIYCTGAMTVAWGSFIFPTTNWCVLTHTQEAHWQFQCIEERESQRYLGF